jgi:hypothetical protein
MDAKQIHAAIRTDSISANANSHRRAYEGLQRFYPEPVEASPCISHPILILCLASRNVSFLPGFGSKRRAAPLPRTCPDNLITIRYLVSGTNHETSHYVILSSPSTLYSDTLSLCSPLNENEDFPRIKVKGFALPS